MIYLDHNATTQPAPEVCDAMDRANRELWANPSSVHRFGGAVRQQVELARASVAELLGCAPRELVFTSGGTESNNLAVRGLLGGAGQSVLITTPVEHAAIREPAEALEGAGIRVVRVPVDRAGVVDVEAIESAVREHTGNGTRVLVSVQWANNETGVIQPITRIAEVVQRIRQETGTRKLKLHTDATQAVGKLPVNMAELPGAGVDLLTFSAHKFHGPKGVGGLVVRRGVRLTPQQRGGPQERDRRGGTENVPAILGLGVAAELAQKFLTDPEAIPRLTAMRDRFESAIQRDVPDPPGVVVNSRHASGGRLWNTSNLAFPGVEAEAVLLGLSERGVCASAGAACSSGSLEPSPVLLAMGIPEPVAHGSVRFSIGRFTTDDEVDAAIEAVPAVIGRLAKAMPMGPS